MKTSCKKKVSIEIMPLVNDRLQAVADYHGIKIEDVIRMIIGYNLLHSYWIQESDLFEYGTDWDELVGESR